MCLALVAAALLAGSCSEGEPDSAIQFDLEYIPGFPWVATGELVDAGLMCSSGARRTHAYFGRAGTPLSVEEGIDRYSELLDHLESAGPGAPFDVDLRIEMEWTCDDGSGSFSLLGTPGGGEWRVLGGTGAYVGMTGEGTSVWEPAPAPNGSGGRPRGAEFEVRYAGSLGFPSEK